MSMYIENKYSVLLTDSIDDYLTNDKVPLRRKKVSPRSIQSTNDTTSKSISSISSSSVKSSEVSTSSKEVVAPNVSSSPVSSKKSIKTSDLKTFTPGLLSSSDLDLRITDDFERPSSSEKVEDKMKEKIPFYNANPSLVHPIPINATNTVKKIDLEDSMDVDTPENFERNHKEDSHSYPPHSASHAYHLGSRVYPIEPHPYNPETQSYTPLYQTYHPYGYYDQQMYQQFLQKYANSLGNYTNFQGYGNPSAMNSSTYPSAMNPPGMNPSEASSLRVDHSGIKELTSYPYLPVTYPGPSYDDPLFLPTPTFSESENSIHLSPSSKPNYVFDTVPSPLFNPILKPKGSPSKGNKAAKFFERIDSFNSVTPSDERVTFVKFVDHKKRIIQTRGGFIPYTIENGKIKVCMAVDTSTGDITDFGGRLKNDENAIDAAIREFHEESLNVFEDVEINDEKIRNSFILLSNSTLIVFFRIDCDFEEKRKEFLQRKEMVKFSENSDFYIDTLENIFNEISKGEGSKIVIYDIVNKLLKSAFYKYGDLNFYLLS